MSPSSQSISSLHNVVLEGWKEAMNLARALPSTERAAFARIISARAEGLAALESIMPGDNALAAQTQSFVQGIAKDKETAWPMLVGLGSFVLGFLGLPAVGLAFQLGAGLGGALFTILAAGGTLLVLRGLQSAYSGTAKALEERRTRGRPVWDVLGRIAGSEIELFSAFSKTVPNPPLTLKDLKSWFVGGLLLGALFFGLIWGFLG